MSLETSVLRERRKGGESLCICRYELLLVLWCEELVLMVFVLFVKKVAKSSALRLMKEEGKEDREEKRTF